MPETSVADASARHQATRHQHPIHGQPPSEVKRRDVRKGAEPFDPGRRLDRHPLQDVPEALGESHLPRHSLAAEASSLGAAAMAVDGSANMPHPEKQERLVQIQRQREAFVRCEQRFTEAADTVRDLNRALFKDASDGKRRLEIFSDYMMASLLTERDVALTVVGDRQNHVDEQLHGVNVSVMAMVLGRELGLTDEEMRNLGQAAVLHDVGKVRLPSRLHGYREELAGDELRLWQKHADYGAQIASDIGCVEAVVLAIRQHHENIDGSGFPDRVGGDQISRLARIIAIANTFDDLCNHAQPNHALTPYEALAQMFVKNRTHFDIQFLSTFIRTMGVYPPGSLVRLSNDMTAMVFSVNVEQPLKPTVLLHDPAIPRDEALLINLGDDPDLNIVRNLRPSQLTPQELAYLAPRKRLTYYFDEVADSSN